MNRIASLLSLDGRSAEGVFDIQILKSGDLAIW